MSAFHHTYYEGGWMFLRVSIQAFYTSESTAEAIKTMREDRRLLSAKIDLQPGGIDGACSILANQKLPELLLVETEETGTALLDALGALAEVCDPVTKVILIGRENDILLYRQLLDMGIQEYLPGPVTVDQLLATIERLFASDGENKDCRILAFIGARVSDIKTNGPVEHFRIGGSGSLLVDVKPLVVDGASDGSGLSAS